MDFDSSLILVAVVDIAYGIGMYRTVLKLYAVGETLHVVFRNVLVGPYLIYFLLDKLRMSQLGCQIAVVCKKQHAGCVAVKSSHRIDAFFAGVLHQIHNSQPSVRVLACRHAVFRLVEQDVALVFKSHYLAVVFDYVEGVEKATLELRATVYNKARTKKAEVPEAFKIADGTNTTYMLVNTMGTPSFEADKYQKIIPETKEAQILYLINSYDVRRNQLKTDEIKAFEQYLKDVKADERRTLKSNDIIAYASPDGGEKLNTKLSDNRGKSAEKAFNRTINKEAKVEAPVNVKSIGQDWEGFQELVSGSNIEDKELILRVLSMYSDPAVREKEIKNMSSVYEVLAEEILPELRRARFIANVEYKNYTDEELLDLIVTDIDVLDEEALLYTATLVESNIVKTTIYETAASKFNSDRAYNNLAAVQLSEGKTADAKAALNKMSAKTSSYYNNMAVVAMQEKDFEAAAKFLQQSDVDEAKLNQAALDILNGKYQAAAEALNGSNTPNEALANILLKNEAKAQSILTGDCPCQAYMRAIIAARKGDAATANKELEAAKKSEQLAKRAETDIEFAKL